MNELSPNLLLAGYANGFFPMADEITKEIYWYKPEIRAIFSIEEVTFPKSLLKRIKKNEFQFRINSDYEQTIRACAETRQQTWISEEIIEAYIRLNEIGFSHSVESYQDNKLVGGLYGVAIGGAFFGESMFNYVSDSAKAAFYHLINVLRVQNFILLDSQFINDFTKQLGAKEISNEQYQEILESALKLNCKFIDNKI